MATAPRQSTVPSTAITPRRRRRPRRRQMMSRASAVVRRGTERVMTGWRVLVGDWLSRVVLTLTVRRPRRVSSVWQGGAHASPARSPSRIAPADQDVPATVARYQDAAILLLPYAICSVCYSSVLFFLSFYLACTSSAIRVAVLAELLQG